MGLETAKVYCGCCSGIFVCLVSCFFSLYFVFLDALFVDFLIDRSSD